MEVWGIRLQTMATKGDLNFMAVLLLFSGLILASHLQITGAQTIGVCNGRNGDNLPPPRDVVSLYQTNKIGRMRIYDPDLETLNALRGSNIELILDVPKDDLQSLSDASAAHDWVQKNIVSYTPDVKFKYIAVGNEVPPSDSRAQFIMPTMMNIFNALGAANLHDQIKVSTSVATTLLGKSYPPSDGEFTTEANSFLSPIISFLEANGSPLLTNVYPYVSYVENPTNIDINYALFTAPGTVVTDKGINYQNLFDALVDSVYSALEKSGGPNVRIVVSESGWPSEGDNAATVENAGTYYKGLINHVNQGTPKKSGQAIEAYLFAMFDENLKPPGVEQHFGLFRPNKEPKYQITFG